MREQFAGALLQAWPKEAGPLVQWSLELPENAPPIVEIVHAGPALGAAGTALLGDELSRELATTVAVRDLAVSPEPITAAPGAGISWLSATRGALAALDAVEGLHGCVAVPASRRGRPVKDAAEIVALLRSSPVFQAGRLRIEEGIRWEAVVSPTPCLQPGETTADAGAGADANAPDGGQIR